MTDNHVSTPWGLYPAEDTYDNGTVVALLSGSPAMTVIGGKDEYALVAWFDDGDVFHQALLPHAALYALDEDEDGVPYANADGETLH